MKEPNAFRDVIALGESEEVEFKARLAAQEVMARILIGFANSQGGMLIIGVGDEGEILGLDEDDARRTESRLKRLTYGLLRYSTDRGEQATVVRTVTVDGKLLVVVAVQPAPAYLRPLTDAQGQAYRRVGARTVRVESSSVTVASQPTVELESTNRLGAVPKVSTRRRLFVAMSFRTEEEPALQDYYRAIQRAVANTKLPIDVVRIDEVEGDYEISQEVLRQIEEADMVVADFTLSPHNVYLEAGYARGKERPIVQCARVGTQLQFDVRNWRTIFYRNATELEEKIREGIEVAYRSLPTRA